MINYKTVLQGSYYTAIDENQVGYQANSLVCIDDEGTIARIVLAEDNDYQVIVNDARQQGH